MKHRVLNGYLTIYVSLSLTIMLSLFLTVIDGARRSTCRLESRCIMDVAMDSVMAEYHKELFNQYNLFYIDSAYGSQNPSYYNTEARLRYYLEKNIDYDEVSYLDFLYKDLMGLQVDDIMLKEVALATDLDGKLFQKKAAEAVWDDKGMHRLEQLQEWVGVIEGNGLLERNMKEEKEKIDAELESYNGKEMFLADNKWITIEIKNPTEHINQMRKKGILKWVLKEGNVLSGQKVDLSQYISAGKKRGILNSGNISNTVEVGVLEQVLFLEYLMTYSGYYGNPKEGSLLQYQAEYIMVGNGSDEENLKQVANTICGIREVSNTLYILSDPLMMEVTKAVSAILASAVLNPELEPLFQATIVMGWAYLESLYDTRIIFDGGKIPLMKKNGDWHLGFSGIWEEFDFQMQEVEEEGLEYKDYLQILLYLSDPEKITFRFMDLMEMDIRKTEGNESFRMDGCIGSLRAEVIMKSDYGYQYILERDKEY